MRVSSHFPTPSPRNQPRCGNALPAEPDVCILHQQLVRNSQANSGWENVPFLSHRSPPPN